jgi:hypothetical protein
MIQGYHQNMAARIPHVVRLDVLDDYRLRLTFDDGLTGDVDLTNLLDAGPVFQPLRDPRLFAQVYIDPQTRTVAWPGGIDLDPEGLHEEAHQHPTKVDPRTSRLASSTGPTAFQSFSQAAGTRMDTPVL